MHGIYKLKSMLMEQLEDYAKNQRLSSADLQYVDMLAHATKNLCKIIRDCEEEEYSRNGGSYGYNSYEDGMSGYGRSYEGMSQRRGRAANGRFVSRDSSEIARRLREMIAEAPDDASRSEMQRLAEKLEAM